MRAIAPCHKNVLLLLVLTLCLWEKPLAETPYGKPLTKEAAKRLEYKTIEWPDLMPEEDLEAILNPPAYVSEVEDGSPEDQISGQIQNSIASTKDDRYQQALVSTKIKPTMNGQAVRIPGFIVPLEFSDEMIITEFFIVPFFGACVHVPPPPPNQIIHVKYAQGFKLEGLYHPIWVSGILKTSLIENAMATAAYVMEVQYLEVFSEE